MTHDGEPVTLSTANGLVERTGRTLQTLPESAGQVAPVRAIVMDEMDLNLLSMGRLISQQRFTSLWSADHGHLWRDPSTGKWTRLRVENYVPIF